MNGLSSQFALVTVSFLLLVNFANGTSRISGKVTAEAARSNNTVILLVLDASGSTAEYAGVDFPEFSQLSNFYLDRRKLGGWNPRCPGRPGPHNLRDSILSAEVVASRRLLSQLDPTTTRVGVITFGKQARLRQALTHDFDEVRSSLDLIYKRGPYAAQTW